MNCLNKIFILVLFSHACISAQIMIGSSSFPKVGDELNSFILNEGFENISPGNAGENQVWDFSKLSGGDLETQRFLSAAEGKDFVSFPDANLLIKTTGEDGELYARALTNRIELVGFAGPNPLFGDEILIVYNKRPQIRRSPMFYETTARSEGEFAIQLSASIIPDTLLSGLPIRPDSIRIQFNSLSNDTIDGFGKVLLGGKTYDVLREKSFRIEELKIFIKIPVLGWIDLGAVLGENLPGGFDGLLGADTTYVYNYYTNTIKEVLVSIETDSDGNIFGINYANTRTVSTKDTHNNYILKVYPNPVSQILNIETTGLEEGNYLISLTDLSGKMILKNQSEISHYSQAFLDVSTISKGLYIIKITNKNGKIWKSQKVMIK